MQNHTSGNPEPSQADIEFTRKLYWVAKDLGLNLSDHIVIDSYHSFADSDVIKQSNY